MLSFTILLVLSTNYNALSLTNDLTLENKIVNRDSTYFINRLYQAIPLYEAGNYSQYFNTAENIYDEFESSPLDKTSDLSARILLLLAISLMLIDDLDESIIYFKEAERIFELPKFEGKQDSSYLEQRAVCYNNIGNYFYFREEYDNSITYFKRAVDLLKGPLSTSTTYTVCIHNIGSIYELMGEYRKALDYHLYSLDLNHPENDPQGYLSYTSIGITYHKLGEFDLSKEYLDKALETAKNRYGNNHFILRSCYTKLGSMHYAFGNYKDAIEYYNKSLSISNKHKRTEWIEMDKVHIALCQTKLGNSKVALSMLKPFSNNLESKSIYRKRWILYAISYSHMELEQLESAYDNLLRASEYFDYPYLREGKFDQIQRPITLRIFMDVYSDVIKRLSDLQICGIDTNDHQRVLKDALNLENYINETIQTSDSKFHHNSKAIMASSNFIDFKIDENDKNSKYEALVVSENNKSRQLKEYLNANRVIDNSIIPESIIVQKANIELEIELATAAVKTATISSKEQSEVDSLKRDLFDKRVSQSSLQDSIEYYSDLHEDYIYDIDAIKRIQKGLPKDQSIIEFFAGDGVIFSFLIKRDTLITYKIENGKWVNDIVKEYRENIYDYWVDQGDSGDRYSSRNSDFFELSTTLYEHLISPISDHLTENILIIPDANLHMLPFETLVTTCKSCVEDLSKCDYMVKSSNISYAPSLEFISRKDENANKKSSLNKLAVFAPSYANVSNPKKDNKNLRGSLHPLKYNNYEASGIVNIISSDSYLNEGASLEMFKSNSPNYRIVHLASHAKSNIEDGDLSFLAFNNTKDSTQEYKLYARDVATLPISAEMVVLSACETGLGENISGEGVIGLARSFFLTGVESVVASLWSVNDASSADFMLEFYKQIKDGKSKSASLRAGKLKLIENKITADPFFWAPFVSYGTDDPLFYPKKERLHKTITFCGILLLLLGGAAFYRRRKKAVRLVA